MRAKPPCIKCQEYPQHHGRLCYECDLAANRESMMRSRDKRNGQLPPPMPFQGLVVYSWRGTRMLVQVWECDSMGRATRMLADRLCDPPAPHAAPKDSDHVAV